MRKGLCQTQGMFMQANHRRRNDHHFQSCNVRLGYQCQRKWWPFYRPSRRSYERYDKYKWSATFTLLCPKNKLLSLLGSRTSEVRGGFVNEYNILMHPQLVQIGNQPSAQNVAPNPATSTHTELCSLSLPNSFLRP